MSEQNKAVVRRIVEDHWNKKNPALIDELFATNCAFHTPDGALQGQDGARQLYNAYATAFPDFRVRADDTLADGNKVVVRYTFAGTHKGPLAAVPASGKQANAGHSHLPSRRWQGRRSPLRLGQVRADATDRCAAAVAPFQWAGGFGRSRCWPRVRVLVSRLVTFHRNFTRCGRGYDSSQYARADAMLNFGKTCRSTM